MKIDCQIMMESNAEHCQQVYAGFAELEKEGILNLKISKTKNYSVAPYGKAIVRVIVNNKFNVVYDLFDGKELVIQERELSDVDFYFKRSFSSDYLEKFKGKAIFIPYGLNYLVYTENSFFFKRIDIKTDLKNSIKTIIRSNVFLSKCLKVYDSVYTCNQSRLESLPLVSETPKVLFMTQCWDPDHTNDPEKKIERHKINSERYLIIKELKKSYGALFTGGFRDTPYARKNFPHCILPDTLTNKNTYIKKMQSSDICIATRGLDDSIGWKFAEYVASSRAIVTEKLLFQVPGDFEEQENYLSFTNPYECLNNVEKLMKEKSLRYQMMINNYHYYLAWVQPKNIILNSLLEVLKHI